MKIEHELYGYYYVAHAFLIYNREKNKLMPSPLFIEQKYNHIHEMLEDRKGVLWFNAHNQVFQLEPEY